MDEIEKANLITASASKTVFMVQAYHAALKKADSYHSMEPDSLKAQGLVTGRVRIVSRGIGRLASAVAAVWLGLHLSPSAEAGSFTNTGAMSAPRWEHTATLLPNGKVLVMGGYITDTNGSNVATSSAEVYDPATGTWTKTGAMSVPRYRHASALLPDGKVLVVGGKDAGQVLMSSAEVYNPADGRWTQTGAMKVARNLHTATLLRNGKVLVAGGCDYVQGLSSAELYDPVAGTWTDTGSLNQARGIHPAVLLANGEVLVAAGWDGGDRSSAELYDPATAKWTMTGGLAASIDDPVSVLLASGQVLLTGGLSHGCACVLSLAELYNPATGIWTKTNSMISARNSHTLTVLPSGKVLVAGYPYASESAELYDPAVGTWATTGAMQTGRGQHTATLLPSGKVLIAGGGSINGPLSSAELYDSSFKISSQPQSQTGYWGKSVSFSVSVADGVPPYRYQWLKDGVAISDATNSLLPLTNLQATNAGIYTVVVSDTVTNLTSQPATLTVNPARVSIALYAGVTIDGVVGQTYGVQSTTDPVNTNSWAGRANITLTTPTYLWYDSQPATQPQTYYRVVPGPISIP